MPLCGSPTSQPVASSNDHLAGGRGLDAHLVLKGATGHAIALARRTVRPRQELRHEEQADTLDALGRVGDLGQHQVDDVLGEVVVARRDEDLRAGDAKGPVVLRHGLGPQEAEIGAAMGFGQAHRAGPRAVHELRQVGRLQLLRGVALDRLIGPVAEAGIEAEGQVRGADHLLDELVDARRQALAAIGGVRAHGGPAALPERLVRLGKALRRTDDAVLQAAALLVAGGVQRQQALRAELAGLLQDGVGDVGGEVFQARQGLGVGVQLVQHEAHVAQGSLVGLHRVSSSPAGRFRSRSRTGRGSPPSARGA